jgi:hypothetical protein
MYHIILMKYNEVLISVDEDAMGRYGTSTTKFYRALQRYHMATARAVSSPADRSAPLDRGVERATAIGLEPLGSGRTRTGDKF